MSLDESSNRDTNRQNKASTLVNACLYSNVTKQGINYCLSIVQEENKKNTTTLDTAFFQNMISILEQIEISNTKAMKQFCRCSTHIKCGAISIAHNESMTIQRALRNNESLMLKNTLRHYDKDVIEMHRVISYTKKNTPDPYHTSVVEEQSIDLCSMEDDISVASSIQSIPEDNNFMSHTTDSFNSSLSMEASNCFKHSSSPSSTRDSSETTTTNKKVHKTPSTISHYSNAPFFFLPLPTFPETMYTPMQAIQIIKNNSDGSKRRILNLPKVKGKIVVRRLSKYGLIMMMIEKKLVPLSKTQLYVLFNKVENNIDAVPLWWTSNSKYGAKPHLLPKTLTDLTKSFHDRTDGGAAISKKELKTTLCKHIIKDREATTKETYKHDTVPETTLRRYVNDIVSQFDFNIFNNVSNKSESRAVSEYSVRSTISYCLAVLTTHFVRGKPTPFHKPIKDLEKISIYQLVEELNKKSLGINDTTYDIEQLIHVLPHLVLSTDECSLFITTQVINKKEVWHFSTRPKIGKTPSVDSNKRDIFSTKLSGDAHMRGLRISLNNTFTAGGRSAPVFACVYGLTMTEMPKDEIVIIEIEGLVAASNQNGSQEKGFIVFVRGATQTVDSIDNSNNQDDDFNDLQQFSKDAKIAKLYREKVFYPFVEDIRKNYYLMPDPVGEEEIPSSYTAISWMDGCHGQLNMTTQESVLDTEKKLKITSCKHSAARTAVEQAADVGPMFKVMKSVIKSMPTESVTISPIFYRVTKALEKLENPTSMDTTKIVKLSAHKRKAIIAGISKLPIAMSVAFKQGYIQSAFRENGQIDKEGIIPNPDKLLGTYRGSIDNNHYLKNKDNIIKTYYDEMYLKGRIEEATFEREGVVSDYDSVGNHVNRDFGIRKENCQRAKILSSDNQRKARLEMIESVKQIQLEKQTSSYEVESKKYKLNDECEERVINGYYAHLKLNQIPDSDAQENLSNSRETIIALAQKLERTHFGLNKHKGFQQYRPTLDQLRVFIQLRIEVTQYHKHKPVYEKVNKKTKEELIDMCLSHVHLPLQTRIYTQPSQAITTNDNNT